MERPREREGGALDGDLPLLHRLEQCRLRLRRGAVDLVGEQQPGEQRTLAEVELAARLVEDVRPGQVRGQQVGGELGAGEAQPERLGDGARGEGLAQAGEVLEQHVPAGQDGREHQLERASLAHDHLLDLVEHCSGRTTGAGDVWCVHRSSILVSRVCRRSGGTIGAGSARR
ncbi:hypothetical protein GCM10025872_10710 [Barrientosiimonas endolithica]|uniref:Uncharacterized protein n=1 Tax=Barrientosiimonas endolithica TaxID=1535208 RepID=A0ABM8H955_9MICO|nr:hypothetical protein GCM10025872_10710 [Barrientosiimonas endolithica]